MKQILVIGAGRSAVTLIDYLLKESHLNLWKVTIADYNLNLAENLASNNSNARPIFLMLMMSNREKMKLEIQILLFQCYHLICIILLLKIV